MKINITIKDPTRKKNTNISTNNIRDFVDVEKIPSSKTSQNSPIACDSAHFVSMFIQPSSEDPLDFTKISKKSKGMVVYLESPYIGCISIGMLEDSAVPKSVVCVVINPLHNCSEAICSKNVSYSDNF